MAQLPTVYAQVTAALAQLNLPTDVIGPIPDLEEIDETMIATMLTAAEDALNPLITEGEQQRAQLLGNWLRSMTKKRNFSRHSSKSTLVGAKKVPDAKNWHRRRPRSLKENRS